jgi:Ni,Fe-hydrogenase III large subunit
MQEWGGNRLSKGLIRPGRNPFPFTPELGRRLAEVLAVFEPDFLEMNGQLFQMPSALSRFERTGVVSYDDVLAIGTVGMAARMSGLDRDIRSSHPCSLYPELGHEPVIKHHGDVYSRVQIRKEEVKQSMQYVRHLIKNVPDYHEDVVFSETPKPNSFTLSLVEGWRGEICHCAITGAKGELILYKVKDPSFHNWLALALAVRNNEISDFPVCNKSFNLSYAGHDL